MTCDMEHYISNDRVREIFVEVDARFGNEWVIPYERVETAMLAEVDRYWNYLPVGERRRGGLYGLVERGPGEMEDVVLAFAEKELRMRECYVFQAETAMHPPPKDMIQILPKAEFDT